MVSVSPLWHYVEYHSTYYPLLSEERYYFEPLIHFFFMSIWEEITRPQSLSYLDYIQSSPTGPYSSYSSQCYFQGSNLDPGIPKASFECFKIKRAVV